MITPLIIGMSGKIASGKDSVGEATIKCFGDNYTLLSFGNELKTEINTIIYNVLSYENYTPSQLLKEMNVENKYIKEATQIINVLYKDKLEGILTDAWNKTPGVRHSVQLWGTDVRRSQDNQYWANKLRTTINDSTDKGSNILISDVRFDNEMDMVKELTPYLIRLDVDEDVQKQRLFQRDGHSVIPQHSSETELDNRSDFFLRINNSHIGFDEIVNRISTKIKKDFDERI